MRFLRRSSRQEEIEHPVQPSPGIWVWEYIPVAFGHHLATRFFFAGGILDLPDTIGPGVALLERPFLEIPGVLHAEPHTKYLAVHWEIDTPEETVKHITATGYRVLCRHFGWSKVRSGHIHTESELHSLRKEEGVDWVIGLG